MMKLYGFFRSGTSHRLRIALALKGLPFETVPVDLRKEAHLGDAYRSINPQGLVPALVDGPLVLTQSPALLEWLEDTHPNPALLPADAVSRARVRALSAIVGCDIHPVNNRRILNQLRTSFGANEDAVNAWCGQWIADGFDAYVALLAHSPAGSRFSWGDQPTLADVYLVPQIESARRFAVDLNRWPRLLEIERECMALPAFSNAAPSKQPDAS
jgi:maleylpyruvate isomerase